MRLLVDLGHPGHVHFYKHALRAWRARGHEVQITVRAKDVTLALLDHYGFAYHTLSYAQNTRQRRLREFVQREYALLRVVRTFRPDVITAIGGAFIAPVGAVTGIPAVVFTDSEHVRIDRVLTYPLATAVCTPYCFFRKAGPRHHRYRGFQELAYLHPARFTPDPAVLDALGLAAGEQYTVVRFIAWDAAHDAGQIGFTAEQKRHLVEGLAAHARLFISAPGELPPSWEHYRFPLGAEALHDLLHYARLVVSEGATTATEAALLGTPAIYVASLVGTMGNFDALAQAGIVEAYRDGDTGLARAMALMEDPTAKARAQMRQQALLDTLIDVTAYIVETVETYARHTAN
ncbi:MAG: DUF354 domain-containing protein [Anaerolineae bacterium]|nr:DUF354 domain-containing protein [Anaerolineae bacterium]